MGALNDAWDTLRSQLEADGLKVIQNPGDIDLPCVLLDAPSYTVPNRSTVEVTIPAHVLVAPPGNYSAVRDMLDTADQIAALPVVLTSRGEPAIFEYGDRQIPSYTLTVTMTVIR
jgi:hypothetical protein